MNFCFVTDLLFSTGPQHIHSRVESTIGDAAVFGSWFRSKRKFWPSHVTTDPIAAQHDRLQNRRFPQNRSFQSNATTRRGRTKTVDRRIIVNNINCCLKTSVLCFSETIDMSEIFPPRSEEISRIAITILVSSRVCKNEEKKTLYNRVVANENLKVFSLQADE